MRNLLTLMIVLCFTASVAAADGASNASEGDGLPYMGTMAACDNGSTTGYVQCDSAGNITVVQGTSSTAATFATATEVTSIGAAYALAVDLPDSTKVVILDNQTDGDVWVSLDGGTTDHYHLQAGDALSLNLAANGLVTTGAVHLKDGNTASTTGSFFVYSFK